MDISKFIFKKASLSISSEKQSALLINLLLKPYSILTIMCAKTIAWFLINFIKLAIILGIIKIFYPIKFIFNIYVILVIVITMISIY